MAVAQVNSWQFSAASYTYGSQQLSVSNKAGNWLFAIAQWENTDDTSVVYVADDAHNFWQPVICTTGSTGNVRTAILLAQDALAANTVYFSSTGFIRNAMYTVVEFSGMQAGYSLDVTAHNESAGATSIAVSATTTQNDFILASAVQDTTANSITITGGGTSIAGGAVATLQTAMTWKTAAAGAQTITFTNSGATSAPWAAVLIAVRYDAPLPQNANPNWPVIACQAAFGFLPGDGSAYPAWTDITGRFLALSGSRGRHFELDQLEAADVTIELDNFDGAFNPVNTTGPYYPNVNLITPVRILATWQGRTHQIYSGQIEYLPQTYDFERGVVKAECTDSFAKLPQVLLQSCMQQEILYDRPWGYWPMNEAAGANFASNHSEKSSDTLHVVNVRGGATSNAFGTTVSPTFKGDQGTCWSVTGVFNSTSTTGLRLYRSAGQLPDIASGVTIECWANCNESGGNTVVVMGLEGKAPTVNGTLMYVGFDGVSAHPTLYWNDTAGSLHSVQLSTITPDGLWHHYAVTMNGSTYTAYFDGASVASGSMQPIRTQPHIIEVGALTSPYGSLSGASSSPMLFAHLAYYDYIIDPERITSHYNSGHGGFVSEFTGQRIMRLLTYVRWSKPQAIDGGNTQVQRLDYLGQGGYGTSVIRGASGLFGSFGTAGTSGSQADLAIIDVGASENGLLIVDRNGTLSFRSRDRLYDPVLRATFGDRFIPLNANPYFTGGLANWTAQNNAVLASGTSTWTYSGIGSAQFHGDGVTATPGVRSENTIPVTVGSSYTVDAWLYSPQGTSTAALAINWYNSSHTLLSTSTSSALSVNPVTPTAATFTATAPASAAFAALVVEMTGTPASSVLLLFDRATLSATGLQVFYQGDIEIDYDVAYLYNDVNITRNVDGVVVRAVDSQSQKQYFPRTYQRTIYTAADDPPSEVAHTAEWLLKAYAQPSLRISRMTIDAASAPDAWPFVLGIDIGDTVTVVRTPVGQPAISATYMIIAIDPNLAPNVATFAYSLAPVLVPVLTLDNPTFGTLGGNSLGW